MAEPKTTCQACGATILVATAQATDGYCRNGKCEAARALAGRRAERTKRWRTTFLDRLLGRASSSPSAKGGPSRSRVTLSIEQARDLLESDSSQNYLSLPKIVQRRIAAGGGFDILPGAAGEFGRNPENAIPVNGPLGELCYLSKLLTDSGCHVICHRLGAAAGGDVYEIVSLDGARWDLLYLDEYHTRKSRALPIGYSSAETDQLFLFATNYCVLGFPVGIAEALLECSQRLFGLSLVSLALPDDDVLRGFVRPAAHADAVSEILIIANTVF